MATSLDLDHLRTLAASSGCGGFSKAAAGLHDGLPDVGSAGLNLLARRGLDPSIELTAIEAAEAFFERLTAPVAR